MNNNKIKYINTKYIETNDISKLFAFPENIENIKTQFKLWNNKLIYKPIILEKINKKLYRPLGEISHLLFLKQQNIQTIKCLIIQGNPLETFTTSIIETTNSRQLNLIEKAIILEKLITQFKTTNTEKYLYLLNEEQSKKQLENILKLNKLITPLKIFIASAKPKLKIALALSSLNKNEQTIIASIINKLNLNANKTKKLIENILYIEKKNYPINNKKTILILLNKLINKYQNKTYTQIEKIIYDKINTLKYPLYQKQINLINQTIKNFKLPPKCKIITPQNLEGEGIKIIINAKNIEEYKLTINKLKLINQNKQINQLFSLL